MNMDPKDMSWKRVPGYAYPQDMEKWYLGEHCNRLPNKEKLYLDDVKSILEGWIPAEPIINQESIVITMGSCFANYFSIWLAENGFNRKIKDSPYNTLIKYGSAFENASVIAQQFRWAFDEFDPENIIWIDKAKQIFKPSEEHRKFLHDTLISTDVLIISLGLSEVWYDKLNNEPLWRAIPLKYYDPERHIFKIESLADTISALSEIDRLISEHTPNLKVVFTISPVRLSATFRPISAITANSASKAIIRAALDEFLRSRPKKMNKTFFYFPSFELVNDIFLNPYEDDNRHINAHVGAQIVNIFTYYYTTYKSGKVRLYEIINKIKDESGNDLKQKVEFLQKVCDERQMVIDGLKLAADERLELIQKLEIEMQKYVNSKKI